MALFEISLKWDSIITTQERPSDKAEIKREWEKYKIKTNKRKRVEREINFGLVRYTQAPP